jgi:hypothetical protein
MLLRRYIKLFACAVLLFLLITSQLCAEVQSGPADQSSQVVSDPVGDTFGTGPVRHDITAVEVSLGAELITFDIRFAGPIAAPSAFLPNSVVGYIDLDVDRNPATGAPSQASYFSPAGPDGIGAEFFVDVFSEQFSPGRSELIDTATMQPVSNADLRVTDRLLSIDVPLARLGGTGEVNFSVIVGTFNEFTDVVTVVPEPQAIVLALVGMPFFLCRRALGQRRP